MSTPDLPYDYEDFGLTPEELSQKYPQGHPEYTLMDWQAIDSGNLAKTIGYWSWVVEQIAIDDEIY